MSFTNTFGTAVMTWKCFECGSRFRKTRTSVECVQKPACAKKMSAAAGEIVEQPREEGARGRRPEREVRVHGVPVPRRDDGRDAPALRRGGVRRAVPLGAAEVRGAIREGERRAVVDHVREHHRRDDPEDERPLPVARDALQGVQHAVVEEDGDADEDERGDAVLRELVDHPQRLRGAEDPQAEAGRETAPPEDQRPEEEDDEAGEDQLMGQPRGLVVVHLLLHEGVPPHGGDTVLDAIEPVFGAAGREELPSTARRPREHREEADDDAEHRQRVHGNGSSSVRQERRT